MTMEIWLAPPAGGKTTFCLKIVHQLLSEQGLKKIWVLVPDQRQSSSFRKQLIQQGGILGVNIGRFDELCKDILFAQNRYLPLLKPALRHRLLREAIRENEKRGLLTIFSSISALPGFQGVLHRVFNEFAQAGVRAKKDNFQTLNGYTAQFDELMMLYQTYQKTLNQIQWVDPHALVDFTNQVLLEETPLLWQKPDLVVIDGFDRFTPPQLALIQWLETLGQRIVVTQTAEPLEDRVVNQRFQRSLTHLKQNFPKGQLTWINQDSFLPSDLQKISRHLLNDKTQVTTVVDSIQLLAVQSPLEEVREALRWVKQKILLNGCRGADIAVIYPDEIMYKPLLLSVGREFGLTLTFSSPDYLSEHPAVQILKPLFNLHGSDFSRRVLLDLLRSPYLNLSVLGLSHQDAAVLDLVSRSAPVISGLTRWEEALTKLAASPHPEQGIYEEELVYSLPDQETALRLWNGLQQFSICLTPPAIDLSVSEWVNWLVTLLEKLGWQDCLEQGGEQSVLEAFRNVLEGLRMGELALGDWKLDYSQFLSVLQGTFGVVAYSQPQHNRQDAVQVLRMIEARGVRFSHVVLMGMAEGGFPQPTQADPFLPDDIRERLGLESRLDQEQASVFYLAFTRADASMLITRPYLTGSGEPLEASSYWNALVEIVGEDKVMLIRPHEIRDLNTAASLQELAFWAWPQQGALPDGLGLEGLNHSLTHQRMVLETRLSVEGQGVYNGKMPGLPVGLKSLLDGSAIWSPSRLETYSTCAFRFWVQSVLSLEEQSIPEPGLQASQLGSMLHQILEEVYAAAEDPENPESVLLALAPVAQRIFDAAPQVYQFSPNALWAVQQAEWLAVLETTIRELAAGGWLPLAHEQKFGMNGQPPLTITLENGQVLRVRGVIDRLDRQTDGSVRVVDYKTGSSHLGKEDLLNGQRLQLPLYALAVAQLLPYDDPVEGYYWALLAQKSGGLKLSRFENNDLYGPQGARVVLMEHLTRILERLAEADFSPKKPEGGCASYCPARLWCWHYQPEGWS